MHRGDGVLDDRLASNLDQLLGDVQADASASAPGQDHGNVAQSGHRLTLPPIAGMFVLRRDAIQPKAERIVGVRIVGIDLFLAPLSCEPDGLSLSRMPTVTAR